MATQDAIFPVAGDATGTINAGVSTAEINVGQNQIFAINASGDVNIVFGTTGNTPAATASNFRIPSGVVVEYDTGHKPSIRLFNPGSGSITYWIQFMSKV